jgi:hypothetical protein
LSRNIYFFVRQLSISGDEKVGKLICFMISAVSVILVVQILAAQGQMPLGFQAAMNNAGQKDILAVRNYESGAVFVEEYTGAERLDMQTEVKTRGLGSNSTAYDGSGKAIGLSGGLEASINSNVIGTAHIAWQSFDPNPSSKGRHQLLGRSVEDLTGVFSIEKFIQLWSDSRPGEISVDWLPCS